ncbi:MAG: N-acetylglucosamine-6-phosphate deacetylase [Clostridiales bacterium GWF2_36_10]|nr:MAG: N-acetylglucosamine-6-phosphate deacetylase [Clostridiales bacterium GWF2_36_10]HAN21442.1 N-acetylglucosamine-6-phosphate deacetylase [Clostridiales bacterium]
MKAIINGKIVLKDRVLTGKTLVFEDKIVDIFDSTTGIIPDGTEIIDAKGAYVAPGLIDVHIHGYLGEDTSDCKPEGIRIMSEGLVKKGVTGWLPTTVTIPREDLNKAADVVRSLTEESKSWMGTTILGMNAEGPYVNPKKKGAQNEAYIQKPDADVIIENSDVIKIVTLAPEMDTNFSAIKKIVRECDTIVSMGHTDASYEQACDAITAGVKQITHLFNAMTSLGHRNPGVVGAALNNDVYVELICDTFHIHPALFSTVYKLKKDKLIIITDCLRSGGLSDGEYTLGGQKIILKGIECRLEDGTIAGSVLTLNKGVYNLLANTDLTVSEAVNCASLNPATALGIADRKGSIEIGKDADIIVADERFEIKKTIIGGSIRYEA